MKRFQVLSAEIALKQKDLLLDFARAHTIEKVPVLELVLSFINGALLISMAMLSSHKKKGVTNQQVMDQLRESVNLLFDDLKDINEKIEEEER